MNSLRRSSATGSRAPTAHAPFLSDTIEFEGHTIALPPAEELFEAACALGIEILFDPMVTASRWVSGDDVARTAERLNSAAETAAALGLRVGHHNHSFEFHHRFDGVSAYERFVSLLDERVVLELDIFWAATAMQNVPALVRRLGSKFQALHVKDGVVGSDPFEGGLSYDPTTLDQRPAGQGALDVEEILAAATSCHYEIVEFDHVDGDVFKAIEASLRFLARRTAP